MKSKLMFLAFFPLALSAQCSIQTPTFPNATVAVPYQATVTTLGCGHPIAWVVAPGSASCPSMSVDSDDVLNTTFSNVLSCPFTLSGTDSTGAAVSSQFSISADQACAHTPVMLASGEILVYRNGLLQKNGSDYSLSSGSLPTITFIVPIDPSDALSATLLRSFTLITKINGLPWTGVGYRLYREDWSCGVQMRGSFLRVGKSRGKK